MYERCDDRRVALHSKSRILNVYYTYLPNTRICFISVISLHDLNTTLRISLSVRLTTNRTQYLVNVAMLWCCNKIQINVVSLSNQGNNE